MRTLDSALKNVRGIGPGFDTLRLTLSIAIVIWHGVQVSYGDAEEYRIWHDTVAGGVAAALLPMFFCLSGFLVIASALRTASLRTFLIFRVLRIAPALLTEVVLSAVVLGPILTSLSLKDYFSSPLLYRYFANVVGWITFALPGVFSTNPTSLVNASLWTIPPELVCYVFLAICMASGIYVSRTKMTLAMFLLMLAIGIRKILSHSHLIAANPAQENLFLCFMIGNLFFLYRDKIYLDFRVFLFASSLGVICIQDSRSIYIGSLLLTYSTVYLGMCRIPKIPLLDRGDYSYGIYLYGFPVQQTIAFFFPSTRIWYVNALLSLPVIVLLAVFSWHVIEKPSLALKRRLQGRRVLDISTGVPR